VDEVREREIRDLPWRNYQTWLIVEYYRVKRPKCGLRTERVDQMPGKAPFSKDFEDEVGLACESAPARQVSRRLQLAASKVRAIDLRYLERWSKTRKRPVVRQLGVLDQPKREGTGSTLRTGAQLYFHPLMPFNAAHRHLEIRRCRCQLVCLHPSRGSRTSLCPAFREHSEASTIRVRNGRIGSIDPSALKIPARRAESSLLDQFHILIFTLSQHIAAWLSLFSVSYLKGSVLIDPRRLTVGLGCNGFGSQALTSSSPYRVTRNFPVTRLTTQF